MEASQIRGTSRERLVSAMSDLLWERGFAATSPREVRERAGVGQGSMYHHFAGKRELALAAMERTVEELLPTTALVLTGAGSPMERLTAYLRMERPALKGCRVGRLTQDPVVAGDPGLLEPVGAAFAETRRLLASVIAEAVAAGELPADSDPTRLAALLSATVQGGYVLAIAAQDTRPFADACEGALELLLAAAGGSGDKAPAGAGAGNGRKHP